MSTRTRAAVYMVLLFGLNAYVAGNLFFIEFTDNMQTNAGFYRAITRFILEHFPHLNWFPWWFNGMPFENTYTPMLQLLNAAVAWTVGTSPAHAYNFVTALFYVIGPVFLFWLAWQTTGLLETSFFAGLLYSLFSSSALLPFFRGEIGWLNPWRYRVLVYWGEGPHVTMLAVFPLALFAVHRALTTRAYIWRAFSAVLMAWSVLVNAFGAVDLAIGCACLLVTLPRKEIGKAAVSVGVIAAMGYLLAIAFLPPSLIRVISYDSQFVDGIFTRTRLLPGQALTLAVVVLVWLATRRMTDSFVRFSLLFAGAFILIVALFAFAKLPVFPQPHRYSLEMDLAVSLAFAFALRPVVLRLPVPVKSVALVLAMACTIYQTVHYRHYARALTRAIDIRQTIEYKTAKWLDENLPGERAFVSGETGTWLNVFADTPQMNSGAQPLDPNFNVDMAIIYSIYSGEGTGSRDAENSILWLKAFGCHTIHVAPSRLYGNVFQHPRKFDGVLPVLWREGEVTIYGVPQRTLSLAHVVPDDALVKRQPVNGLDTAEVMRYVSALDDPVLPSDVMQWPTPDHGHLQTTIRSGQSLSIQVTYDPGWIAFANGRRAAVTRDGLGLNVIHTGCDGACAVDFIFDGGIERKLCRAVSGLTIVGGLLWGLVNWRRMWGGFQPAADFSPPDGRRD